VDISGCKRIVVLGPNGSGKSCFSRELAGIMGLPLIHLDAAFWRPGWACPSQEEWHERNLEYIAGERWIIDGMCSHGGTMDLRFEAADLAIVLDVNRWVCLVGLLRRNGKDRPDRPQARDEKFDRQFFRFCLAMLRRTGRLKREYQALHEKYPGTAYMVIKGRRGMRRALGQS